VSLARLLTEIVKHPHVLSRKRFVGLYQPDLQNVIAHTQFDRYVAAGASHIDPTVVRTELDDLCKSTKDVERYGTKRVAHYDDKGPKNIPTFQELDDALDLIHTLRIKYLFLLRAVTYNEPVWAYDWKAIFRVPWM
jgi:hypothetical protein